MRGVHPADKAHRLIDEAEFELELDQGADGAMQGSRSHRRAQAAAPPADAAVAASVCAARHAPEAHAELPETLAGRLAIVEAS